MRPILVIIIVAIGLAWGGSVAGQTELPAHQQLTTTIEKIQSGLMYFKSTERLGHREVSIHKAERMGLSQAKVGDEVILVIDDNNLLIDLHRKDIPPAGHRRGLRTWRASPSIGGVFPGTSNNGDCRK